MNIPNASSKPTIRPATLADAEIVARFNERLAGESEGKTLDPDTVLAGVRAGLTDPNRSTYYLAEVDGVVAGQLMITTEWSDWRNGYFWWIQSVYVDLPFRRRGVFRSLHNHVRDLARARPDVCGLRLYVHISNTRALDTYRKLGMDVTEYQLCEEEWR